VGHNFDKRKGPGEGGGEGPSSLNYVNRTKIQKQKKPLQPPSLRRRFQSVELWTVEGKKLAVCEVSLVITVGELFLF
jgi:hypothetical protein